MKRCIACGAPLWETPLLTLDNMPASAQHMPDADHVGADKGLTLDLCQCSGCGLVQFDCEPVTTFVLSVVLPATCMDAGAGWTPRGSPFTDAIRYGQSRSRGAVVPVPALVFCAATLVTVSV